MPSVPKAPTWDVQRLPRAEGRNFLVTGGNAGIGYFVAEQLAGTGATVVLGSRDETKAKAAIASISSRVPGAQVRHLPLDLADLASLRTSVDALELDRLDAVVHNAGVALDQPPRRETKAGQELMFATNHLGHFALTHWLTPCSWQPRQVGSSPRAASRPSPNAWTSTISRARMTTSPSAPMRGRNWPRCTSLSSSTAAWALPAAPR